jgi:hypothetical protein
VFKAARLYITDKNKDIELSELNVSGSFTFNNFAMFLVAM